MKKLILLLGVAALAVSGSANATVLLNLIDPPAVAGGPYALTFIAASTATTLDVAGYQLPSNEQVYYNGVFASGSATNLLQQRWKFTPAPSGSDAAQDDDGTSVYGLDFEGATIGSYDTFSQTFATTVGVAYTYDFVFIEPGSTPSGLEVSEHSAVPEPGVWSLMLAGLGGLGAALRLSRRKRLGAVV